MFKSLTEALTAWKGKRDMAKDRNQPTVAAAPSAQRSTKVAPSNPVQGFGNKEQLEEKIRVRAYLLAEEAGFPTGRADEFWLRAEREIGPAKSR
jgi:hypothetical protein